MTFETTEKGKKSSNFWRSDSFKIKSVYKFCVAIASTKLTFTSAHS